ncbi:MAG TPA: 4Fe-4S dicluster domain-containing protein [Paracoccaceae bacterium]|nr:4Fe-4S dicluster domain-containing protein [Paracoccaceae bacterium]
MTDRPRTIFLCSCERTMAPDEAAVARACTGRIETATQLCGRQLARFREALAEGGSITVGCTQEQPLFEEVAEETGHTGHRAYANIRETAGWTQEARASGPKTAALLAAAAEPVPPIRLVSATSEGVVLILGRDETATEAGSRLAEHLDVTVLVEPGTEILPPRRREFPILQGRVRKAEGHLGAFRLAIDDFAYPSPSSRHALAFGQGTDGAVSEADIILDLRGGRPLFAADELRPGYLRADPGHAASVEKAIAAASHLVGTFDKPRYVGFDATLCAHSRNRITGCTRCLDLCPTGAIAPAGDAVEIDPMICAGCGQCAAACPTGAVHYALPPVDALLARLRTLLRTYAAAGGKDAVVLLHDAEHGAEIVELAGRFSTGIPARVLPLAVNEITSIGPEALAAALAWGAAGVRILSRAKPLHDLGGLHATLALANAVAVAIGYPADALDLVATDDPDALTESLAELPRNPDTRGEPSAFLPGGEKRGLLVQAFRELHRTAPAPVDRIPLPAGAPFGAAVVETDGCTLCLSCAAVCPTGAFSDNPERPMLRFTESLCVQCGLCAATCPEEVITLAPRIDIPAWDVPRRVVKEEEPFHCITCGKPFGTRSTIERIRDKLSAHWMYSGPEGEARRRVLEMCEDCRVGAVVTESFDPHDLATRTVRTTDDYLRERGEAVRSAPAQGRTATGPRGS